jgi:hypothetical protein
MNFEHGFDRRALPDSCQSRCRVLEMESAGLAVCRNAAGLAPTF